MEGKGTSISLRRNQHPFPIVADCWWWLHYIPIVEGVHPSNFAWHPKVAISKFGKAASKASFFGVSSGFHVKFSRVHLVTKGPSVGGPPRLFHGDGFIPWNLTRFRAVTLPSQPAVTKFLVDGVFLGSKKLKGCDTITIANIRDYHQIL